jgi:hypothetical protein
MFISGAPIGMIGTSLNLCGVKLAERSCSFDLVGSDIEGLILWVGRAPCGLTE